MSFDMFSALGYKVGFWVFPFFIYFYMFWLKFFLNSKSFNRMMSFSNFIFSSIINEMRSKINTSISFSSYIISSLFMLLLSIKLWKFSPYNKGFSGSMMFTLSLAFLLWLSINCSSLVKNMFQYFSHYTPVGSPTILVPFIKLVEMVSKFIRPMTLGVRLAVKLLTGHLLVSMFANGHSSFFLNYWLFSGLMLGLVGLFIMFYESCVCVIQALVYCLMVSQYFDEHSL